MKQQALSIGKRQLGPVGYKHVRAEIVGLLDSARSASVRSVNALMTATYWEVGRRIVEFEQKGKKRAGYGEAVIRQLAHDLTDEFGRGFGVVNLSQMKKFYLAWPTAQIFQTLSEKSASLPYLAQKFSLPWSAYVRLLSVKNGDAAPSMSPRRSVRDGLFASSTRQIQSQFYERIALSGTKPRC